jgi:nucleoid DNA-binding protein
MNISRKQQNEVGPDRRAKGAKSSRQNQESSKKGREELDLRVQAALNLATKKEAASLANVFVSCLEDTLVDHLAEDGFCLKLNGFGKFTVRHRPSIRKRVGFSGENREIPPKRKVKFLVLGKLRQLETAPVSKGVASGQP